VRKISGKEVIMEHVLSKLHHKSNEITRYRLDISQVHGNFLFETCQVPSYFLFCYRCLWKNKLKVLFFLRKKIVFISTNTRNHDEGRENEGRLKASVYRFQRQLQSQRISLQKRITIKMLEDTHNKCV
jgi:hypothetical protein